MSGDQARDAGKAPAEQPIPERSVRGRRLHSTELLNGDGQLVIEHAGREYRLRVTSKGKLILTA